MLWMHKIFWCTQELIGILAVHLAQYLPSPGLWITNMYLQLKLENIISLIPEPAALCIHGFTMFMLFSYLLIRSTGQRYDTQQLGQINIMHPSTSSMTSACNHSKTNYKKMSLYFFSTINHAITFKLQSLNCSFIFYT